MDGQRTPQLGLDALTDAVLSIAAAPGVEPVLENLVDAARELVGARYAAVGVPDDEGGFAVFITSGMTDSQIEAIGPLPREHGMLDAVLQSDKTIRMHNLQQDARFEGWPDRHPDMRSLLGVPIVSKGTTIGAFYLTNKKDTDEFTGDDQALIERFAAHAAVAIESAQLLERSRELSIVEERNRLARDLHDSVTQTLFSLTLTAQAAVQLLDKDQGRARKEFEKVQELASDALGELRSLVFELRPADLGADGLIPTLRKHLDIVRRTYDREIELDVHGERRLEASLELAVFRIVQEALNNALKHSGAKRIVVDIAMDDGVVSAAITDDGVGFEPAGLGVRTKHLGLTSMEERAHELGGSLRIDSAPGKGTTVSIQVNVKA